jgi:hypothetical protein
MYRRSGDCGNQVKLPSTYHSLKSPACLCVSDHVACCIVNADHSIVRAAVMLGIADCIADRIRPVVPQPTERQRVREQIKAAMIFARADCVSVHHFIIVSSRRYAATVKEQAVQMQKVSAELEVSKAAPQTVLNSQ